MMELKTNGPVLKTLLISDLVESTRLVERLGDKRAALLFARHDRLARDLLARHAGLEIDKADGFLLLFERPLCAVRYALEYHQALGRLAADLDELAPDARLKETLSARVGIHLGEVILRHNPANDVARGAKPIEVEGLAKPIASRLMSLAEPRQTLLTRGACELARRAAVDMTAFESPVCWLCHGTYRIHGVDRPLRIYEVGTVGIAPLVPPEGSEKMHPAVGEETLPRRWYSPGALAVPSASPEPMAGGLLSPNLTRPVTPDDGAEWGHGGPWGPARARVELLQPAAASGQELIARITASASAEAERRLALERSRSRYRLLAVVAVAALVFAGGMALQEYRIAAAVDHGERETERASRAVAASQQLSQLLADLVAAKGRGDESQGILLRGDRHRELGPLEVRPDHGSADVSDDVLILLQPSATCPPAVPLQGPLKLH